jgi:hypothetical protein
MPTMEASTSRMLALVYSKSYTKHCNTTLINTPKYDAIKCMPY